MSIANNMKRLREMHGLSQKEFGKIAGVTDKAVSTWENGTKTPRMSAISKIAEHFGLQKSNLIEDGGLNPENISNPDEHLKGIDFALWGEVKDLTPSQKEDILKFIRFTKSKDNNEG